MKIEPLNRTGDSRTGHLEGLTKGQIIKILGFKPNVQNDPSKVVNAWGFTVDDIRCAIWDYKGSHKDKYWSTFGPDIVLQAVFPQNYHKD